MSSSSAPTAYGSSTCDVASPDSVAAAVDEVVAWASPIRHLVNSAGNHHRAPTLALAFEDWRRILSVHLDGTFLVTQRVAQHMADHGGGSVVNLGSVAMFSGWQERVAYGAAKAAIGALSASLAVEWAGLGIRVNTVAPGYTNTPFVEEVVAEGYIDADVARGLHALGRFATPDEVVDAILFLLSDRASFITGEVLRVDGGFVAKKLP